MRLDHALLCVVWADGRPRETLMNRAGLQLYVLLLLALASTGCDLAQGIFKAGFTVGLIVVALAVVLVLVLVMKFRR